jgi:hypothetical protein
MLSQHNNLTLHLSWRFTLVFSQAARVEYPLNSTNTVLWTGSSPAAADGKFVSTPDGLWSVSDELALPTPIPDNAMFWVRLWQSADASPPSGTLPGLLFHDLTNNLCALDVNGQPAPFNDRSVSNRLDETNFIFNPFPAIIDKPVFQRDNGNGTQTCLFDYWDQGDPYGAYPYWISTRPLAILGRRRSRHLRCGAIAGLSASATRTTAYRTTGVRLNAALAMNSPTSTSASPVCGRMTSSEIQRLRIDITRTLTWLRHTQPI